MQKNISITAKAHILEPSVRVNSGDTLEEDHQEIPVPEKEHYPHRVAILLKAVLRFVTYRYALPVTEFALYKDLHGGETAYYYCPRCDVTLERDYQAYCDRCGQCLDWNRIHKAKPRQRTV